MNSLRVSVWLRRIVVCLGISCCCLAASWAQDPKLEAVEAARLKRLEAEIAEKRAKLEALHQLELDELKLEEDLRKDEFKLEDKRKRWEEVGRTRQTLFGDAPRTRRETTDDGQDAVIRSFLPTGSAEAAVPAAASSQFDNAFLDRKIHVLLYANTNDKPAGGIGAGAEANRQFLRGLFNQQFKSRAVIVADSMRFDANSIRRDIDGLNLGPTDAVFVHISTHGGFLNGEHTLSPAGSDRIDPGIGIPRGTLMASLRNKTKAASHLRVLITDSCATIMGTRPVIRREESEDRTTQELFRLLMTTTGEVSVNAAAPDTAALYFPELSMSGGGVFTRALLVASVYGGSNRSSTGTSQDWYNFFVEVSRISQNTRAGFQKQPPAYWFSADGRNVVLK